MKPRQDEEPALTEDDLEYWINELAVACQDMGIRLSEKNTVRLASWMQDRHHERESRRP